MTRGERFAGPMAEGNCLFVPSDSRSLGLTDASPHYRAPEAKWGVATGKEIVIIQSALETR